MRTQDLLAQAYRKGKRPADARRIEHTLLKLLAVADQDHVMLRAIKDRQTLRN